ncbi:hypothetical protein POJ06DRAFT_302810 [Lipomyces tetrasporus]|uniref:Uncharacterized protein n=1 Tax=Lipomyces tetrasporus TaxID=54092 RepID=A0AAD7QSL3_9ASCO|nr:uncharacterized protein POJ06DRAFT_302810 [Lipomyces tetrasporus]KAJ8098957.1 hypothetical protein POJ06DRAFT_302810 [Lipomyces tetrasporus]
MVLLGDTKRILQIIVNLISNGLKFTPANGFVDVRVICLGVNDHHAANLKRNTDHNQFDCNGAKKLTASDKCVSKYARPSQMVTTSVSTENLSGEENSDMSVQIEQASTSEVSATANVYDEDKITSVSSTIVDEVYPSFQSTKRSSNMGVAYATSYIPPSNMSNPTIPKS